MATSTSQAGGGYSLITSSGGLESGFAALRCHFAASPSYSFSSLPRAGKAETVLLRGATHWLCKPHCGRVDFSICEPKALLRSYRCSCDLCLINNVLESGISLFIHIFGCGQRSHLQSSHLQPAGCDLQEKVNIRHHACFAAIWNGSRESD